MGIHHIAGVSNMVRASRSPLNPHNHIRGFCHRTATGHVADRDLKPRRIVRWRAGYAVAAPVGAVGFFLCEDHIAAAEGLQHAGAIDVVFVDNGDGQRGTGGRGIV